MNANLEEADKHDSESSTRSGDSAIAAMATEHYGRPITVEITPPAIKCDPAKIRRALGLLCEPGAVYELRGIDTTKATVVGYFTNQNLLAKAAVDICDQLGAMGTYITINPLAPELLARANNRIKHSCWPYCCNVDSRTLRAWPAFSRSANPKPKTYLVKEGRRYEANRPSAPHNLLTTFGSGKPAGRP
jgi:hypothetical protein